MIREYFEKRRTRKLFREFLEKDALESALQGKSTADVQKLKPAAIEVVVAVVRGGAAEVVSERMGVVAEIAVKHDAIVADMVSSMVVMTYGMFPEQPVSSNRVALAQHIAEQLHDSVKVIRCAGNGFYGCLGSNARLSYSFIIPGFIEMLGVLASMNFGETREFRAPGA